MNDAVTTMPTAKHDWSRLDAMTDEQIHAAAMADPDARPMTDEEWARARKVPRIKTIRRALKLTLAAFADRYRIPLASLQDWENGVSEPDPVANTYLRAIAGNPTAIFEALRTGPGAR
jgi:putative transcriptional regulator